MDTLYSDEFPPKINPTCVFFSHYFFYLLIIVINPLLYAINEGKAVNLRTFFLLKSLFTLVYNYIIKKERMYSYASTQIFYCCYSTNHRSTI